MPMLNLPQNRTALTKLILVGASIVMGFAILGIWTMAFSDRSKVDGALLKAARVRPVQFTAEDALAARARLEKLAHPAGEATSPDEEKQAEENKDGKDNKGGQGSPEARKEREKQLANRGPLSEEFATLLEKRPLFGASPKSGPPQANVQGILGDQALINGDWLKIGEEKKGIKLVATLPDKVVVEIEGQQKEASVWQNLPDKPMPPSPLANQSGGSMGGGALSARERAMMMKLERKQGGSGASFREALRQRAQRGDSIGAYRDLSRSQERRGESGENAKLGLMAPGAAGSLSEKLARRRKSERFQGTDGMSYGGDMGGGMANPMMKASKKMKNYDGSGMPGGMGSAGGSIPKMPKVPKAMRAPGFSGGMSSGGKMSGSGMSGGAMSSEKALKKHRDGSASSSAMSPAPTSRKGGAATADPSRSDRSSRLRKARDIYRQGSGQ